MVSVTTLLATSTTLVAYTSALEVGEYFRPTADMVSGVPNKDAPYRRSPCPVLNTLANHGYINRNGQNLTSAGLRAVIQEHLNIEDAIADLLVAPLPETLDLNLLGKHKYIEHDGSMVHADAYYGADPSQVNETMLQDIVRRVDPKTNIIDLKTFGEIRRDRAAACLKSNPDCTFGKDQEQAALGAVAAIIKAFGDSNESISRDNYVSVLGEERLPKDFKKPSLITLAAFGELSAKVGAAEQVASSASPSPSPSSSSAPSTSTSPSTAPAPAASSASSTLPHTILVASSMLLSLFLVSMA